MARATARSIRVDDETWAELEQRASAMGESIAAYLLRRALREDDAELARLRAQLAGVARSALDILQTIDLSPSEVARLPNHGRPSKTRKTARAAR